MSIVQELIGEVRKAGQGDKEEELKDLGLYAKK